jgi:hypothetical protein
MSDSVAPDPIQHAHQDAIRLLIDGESTWDQRLIRASFWLNPILVKETRQALKSKQFAWTFMLLIIFTIGWTLLAVLSSIPNVYYDSDGSIFLVGYLIILLLPSTIVIPQAAFRSMSSELEDGTFETLSLSMLRAGQVVYGKLSVATLQLVVYLSILAPCIALTYLLRGVTLESIIVLLVVICVVCIFLSATAILLASASRTRAVQILLSVTLIGLQFLAAISCFAFIMTVVADKNLAVGVWKSLIVVCLVLLAYSWLWLRCAASLIDLASANRSTPVRVAVFGVGLCLALTGAFFYLTLQTDNPRALGTAIRSWAVCCWIHWGIAGAWMMGESGLITQRARRTLPDTYFGRLFLTWFNPGAGPAYILVVLGFLGPWLGFFAVTDLLMMGAGRFFGTREVAYSVWIYTAALAAYLALYLGVVRLGLLAIFRKSRASRIMTSFAMTGVLVMLGILFSVMISFSMNRFQATNYEWYCFVNPIWTLSELSENATTSVVGGSFVLFPGGDVFLGWVALMAFASLVFFINWILSARGLMLTRTEPPPRVLAESSKKTQSDEGDPWNEA